MASEFLLLKDLKESLVKEFEDMPFREPVRKGQPKTAAGTESFCFPRIYIGDTPPKRAEGSGEDFPFIVIRPVDGELPAGQPRVNNVTVAFVMGLYSSPEMAKADKQDAAEAGTQEFITMRERITRLLSEQRYWGDDQWAQTHSITWEYGLSKRIVEMLRAGWQAEAPYYGGVVTTQFQSAGVVQQVSQKIVGIG